MSAGAYLSRVHLRRDVPAAALREVLLPHGESPRTASAHRLIWTLFADTRERTRDFLWREGQPGKFYVLSARLPEDRHGLFEVDEPRPFAPSLRTGERLSFALRVNATVARSDGPGRRGKPCDIVMDALKAVPPGSRAEVRREAVVEVATKWLEVRAGKSGFAVCAESTSIPDDPMHVGPVQVRGYRVLRMARARGSGDLSIGVLDIEGDIEVRDPDTFLSTVRNGFGRAKAFGCGLMLIKRP